MKSPNHRIVKHRMAHQSSTVLWQPVINTSIVLVILSLTRPYRTDINLCESYPLKGLPQNYRIIRGWRNNSLIEPWRIVPSTEFSFFARVQVTRWKNFEMFTFIMQPFQFWCNPNRTYNNKNVPNLSQFIQIFIVMKHNTWTQFKSICI
jgi:hypothetical protein